MQRYQEYTEILKNDAGKRRYSTLFYPDFEKRSSDLYIITKSTDRLDLLAYQYYRDSRYWVIIAKANKLHDATIRVPIGIQLRIPYPLTPDLIETYFREKQL